MKHGVGKTPDTFHEGLADKYLFAMVAQIIGL